jgi:hypothetical protein
MQKHKNIRKEDNITSPKVNNSRIMDSKDREVGEISDKEFNRMIVRIISGDWDVAQ